MARTLTYCHNGGVAETLDLYAPVPSPGRPVPIVVFIHGGSWVEGSSALTSGSVAKRVEDTVVGHGWLFASINYRLAPKYRWPAQIVDAKCAIRSLRAHAHDLGLDPSRIGVMGESAGGPLAALVGLAGPKAGFDTGEHLDQSSAVQAVVDQSGPADLTSADWLSAKGRTLGYPAFHEPFGVTSSVLLSASPVSYAGPDDPPFLLQHGASDGTVPPDQAIELQLRLEASGGVATLEMVTNAGHGFIQIGRQAISPSLEQLATDAASFFVEHLSGGGSGR